MKAITQYNDYLGTAAADKSDHFFLSDYLKGRGVDTERYNPIGVEFYSGDSGYFSYSFICEDTESDEPNKAVKIKFESKDTYEDFFSLFKRFNVIITWAKKGHGYADWELDENSIMIDDRK